MHSQTEENYLKAIYKLFEDSNEAVNTNSIAEVLNTKAASVTDMMKKLADKKLINYTKYQGVTLTKEGEKIALQIVRKHRLWEVFLVDKLNFKWDEVHDIAEELEHINSEELMDRLSDYLGNPRFDPHGDPIPTKGGSFAKNEFIQLSKLKVNDTGKISGVRDHSISFLQYLEKLNLVLGKAVTVVDKSEYDGSMQLSAEGGAIIYLSKEVSNNILVLQ